MNLERSSVGWVKIHIIGSIIYLSGDFRFLPDVQSFFPLLWGSPTHLSSDYIFKNPGWLGYIFGMNNLPSQTRCYNQPM